MFQLTFLTFNKELSPAKMLFLTIISGNFCMSITGSSQKKMKTYKRYRYLRFWCKVVPIHCAGYVTLCVNLQIMYRVPYTFNPNWKYVHTCYLPVFRNCIHYVADPDPGPYHAPLDPDPHSPCGSRSSPILQDSADKDRSTVYFCTSQWSSGTGTKETCLCINNCSKYVIRCS